MLKRIEVKNTGALKKKTASPLTLQLQKHGYSGGRGSLPDTAMAMPTPSQDQNFHKLWISVAREQNLVETEQKRGLEEKKREHYKTSLRRK